MTKKILLLLLTCVSTLLVKGQIDNVIPSCSMDDYILLKNHPKNINDFEAGDLIQRKIDKVPIEQDGYYQSYAKEKDALSLYRLNASKKRSYVFLKTNAEGKRYWVESKGYFFYSHTHINGRFRTFCIIVFTLSFLFLLGIINQFSYGPPKWDSLNYSWNIKEHRKKILEITVTVSAILGVLFYLIYLTSLDGQLESSLKIKLQILEPLIFLFGTILSSLFYIGLLIIYYFVKNLIIKIKEKKKLSAI